MREKISSKLTFLHKFIIPSIILLSILETYFTDSHIFDFVLQKEILFIAVTTGAYLFFWFHLRSKEVSIEGDFLYVSNFLKEIKIPLSEVRKVTEMSLMNPNPVTIHLKNETRFGRKIIFIPTYRMFSFFSSHPIVEELKERANIY